jgi:release factor glutamine methyltransferase
MEADRPASELERAAYRELVERAAAHEPVDYLIGEAPFFSMMLTVTPAVLIPRPSTETLVEHVVQHARRTPGFSSPLIFEIGTGCGAVAVALARHIRGCRVVATDISDDALAVARDNAASQDVGDRVDFVQGDLLAALPGDQRCQYLVSNPPYISETEWQQVASNVKDYEPHQALLGGADGLKYIRPIMAGAHDHVAHPGQLVLEIAASQKQAVLKMAQEQAFTNAHVLADHERLPRVLVADLA